MWLQKAKVEKTSWLHFGDLHPRNGELEEDMLESLEQGN